MNFLTYFTIPMYKINVGNAHLKKKTVTQTKL